MSKYAPLARHLSEIEENEVTLSFEQIDQILGGNLPQSAYDHRPWWANRSDGTGSQNQGWQSVGWESGDVDMEEETVTFRRVVKIRNDFKDVPHVRPLTIAQAKEGLALMFNVSPENVEVNIRG